MFELRDRFYAHVAKGDGCWEWTGSRDRYGLFRVGKKIKKAHRSAWEMENGPIPDGLFVLHRCDNPPCVRPDHLFLGTQTDNMQDAATKQRRRYRTGPRPEYRGTLTPAHKLSEADVVRIRELSERGWTLRRLALEFHVGQTAIFKVVHRQSWTHV